LRKLLAKAPEERYLTAGKLLADLDRLFEGDPTPSRKSRSRTVLAAVALTLVLGVFRLMRPGSEEPPVAPPPLTVSLPLRFVARHEHRVGHCTGDLSLAESGIRFESPRHDDWHFRPEQIDSLVRRSETELELQARIRGEPETFRFTFLRPPLADGEFRGYWETVLSRKGAKE
jgi:hypothetical protein